MAVEPVWNLVHQGLVAALSAINTAGTTAYWHTVKKVYDYRPPEWDASLLPAIAIYPMPSGKRTYAEGALNSRQIQEFLPFFIEAKVRESTVFSPATIGFRMLADIHRAVYVQPNLGLNNLRRIQFPTAPRFESGFLRSDEKTLSIHYVCVANMAYLDPTP